MRMSPHPPFTLVCVFWLAVGALVACDDPPAKTQTNRDVEARKAAQAAKSVQFEDNAERDNIVRRVRLTADPGKLGFIVLLNEAGQPILYEGVKGKVTSGGKRLTKPFDLEYSSNGNGGHTTVVTPAPADEGTWGQSGDYIFYWNTDDVYRQWNGPYLYSDQPIRLRVEPLVISTTAQK